MARIGPPAMMPVPAGAARSTTLPAPKRPLMSWCRVRPSRRGTRRMLRLADSVALRIASGTSRALPWPKPTRPRWSPTTTKAAKPKRRPPLTTLATRLMPTSLSTISESSRSRGFRSSLCGRAILRCPYTSERQAGFTHRIRECLHATMIKIAATVEDDLAHPGLLRALGNQLAHLDRRVLVRAGLDLAAQILVDRRSCRERHAVLIIDDLGVDVLARTENRQTRSTVCLAAEIAAHTSGAPPQLFPMAQHYFFLPSLRMICSSA